MKETTPYKLVTEKQTFYWIDLDSERFHENHIDKLEYDRTTKGKVRINSNLFRTISPMSWWERFIN